MTPPKKKTSRDLEEALRKIRERKIYISLSKDPLKNLRRKPDEKK